MLFFSKLAPLALSHRLEYSVMAVTVHVDRRVAERTPPTPMQAEAPDGNLWQMYPLPSHSFVAAALQLSSETRFPCRWVLLSLR